VQKNEAGQFYQFRRVKFDRRFRGCVNLANDVSIQVDDSWFELGLGQVSIEDFDDELKEDS
jgi:hypothetical protein